MTIETTPAVANGNGAPPAMSLLQVYASEHGMDGAAMYDTLAATIFPNGKANRTQVDALLIVARAYRLNPFTRELWAFPSKGGGIVPIVSVDGWLKLATTHPQCAGLEVAVAMGPDGRVPVSATCRVHRHDWKVPFELTEYYHEVKRGTEPWKNQPVRMLRHRAMIQAVRVAFGFGGIYEADEAARRPDVDAPPEWREAEVVRRDPLSRELEQKTTDDAVAPREEVKQGESGIGRMAGDTAAAREQSEAAATSPHQAAINAFVVLGVPSIVIECEIKRAESEAHANVPGYLRELYRLAKADGIAALLPRLASERACDLLQEHLDAAPTTGPGPAERALFPDAQEHEDAG